jgi:hypothetical protein
MAPHSRITSKGGWARGLLPFYSADQVASTAAVLLLIFVLLHAWEPGAAGVVTLCAGVGASLVTYSARPAFLHIKRGRRGAVVEALNSIDYCYIPERDHWVPPIPRWQRWTYNFVTIREEGVSVRVYGPANLLRFLRESA